MLSSLSNYLFNTASPLEDVTNLRNNAEYQTQELDDDWLLVNALGEKSEETSPSDSSETELSDSRSTSPTQTVKKSQNHVSRRSRKHALKLRFPTSTPDLASPPSSPNQQMDGSWYVTPPPCFTASTGPVAIETSPMENLLIEHPSMSVYGPIPGFSFLQGSQCSELSDTSPVRDLDLWVPRTATPRNSSVDHNVVSNDQETRDSRTARRATHRRISCSNLDSVALEEQRFVIHSRRYQQQREQRKMKPSYLERQNLTRQYQSYRRQRNHHLKQPIKFCNNRC